MIITPDSLELRIAQQSVEHFRECHDELTRHSSAVDRDAYSELLASGISACKQLERAESTFLRGFKLGLIEDPALFESALRVLYSQLQILWQENAHWIDDMTAPIPAPANLEEYSQCGEKIDERLAEMGQLYLLRARRVEKFLKEPW